MPIWERVSWFSLLTEWVGFFLLLPSPKPLEQFLPLFSITANTRTEGVLDHFCASPLWNFWILMYPDYFNLTMKQLIFLGTFGYKHDLGAVSKPNRRDSHPKNNAVSFTLQWASWKKYPQEIQMLKGNNLLREILSVRKFPEGESTKGHVVPWFEKFWRTEKCMTGLLVCITAVVY